MIILSTCFAVLREHGYEVFTAYNGLHVYGQYFSHPSERVVTDIEMPGMNGLEIKAVYGALNPNVRTIYASGALDYCQTIVEDELRAHEVTILSTPSSTKRIVDLMNANNVRGAEFVRA